MKKRTIALVVLGCLWISQTNEPVLAGECVGPPFVSASAPPLVMMVLERDHRLFTAAYNDASDIDEDGVIETGYKHTLNVPTPPPGEESPADADSYYGYFDPHKCYTYDTTGTDRFVPSRNTRNKYCNAGIDPLDNVGGSSVGNEWSGNFLNWLSMSRMDVIRKVLYGGHRLTDSGSSTVLEGVYIPHDAHSWGKEYAGADTAKLTPYSAPDVGKRHLFCNSSKSANDPHLLRVALNETHRMWEWAATERPCCSGPDDGNKGPVGTRNDINDFYVRVEVCKTTPGLEANCKPYPGGGGSPKPEGLLQKYGEGDGTKVCSKTWKTCATDAGCGASEGICIDKAGMYFGLVTGSYMKNLSGGVLRKNIYSVTDETNAQSGIFQTSENVQGNIIHTIDRMQIVGYQYSDYSYQAASGGTCGWIETRPLNEGECRNWGNPIGEMMYEGLRYLAGKGSPTTAFTYSENADSSLNLSKPDWGIKKGNNFLQPYDIYPSCSKPFMLVISDVNINYDSNQIPGANSNFGSFTGDLSGLNVSTLANTIGEKESINGNSWIIGQSIGTSTDFLCSSKSVTGLGSIRGLCPEEPTKQGSYYSAAVAYYGNQYMSQNTGKPNVTTMAVALAAPFPDMSIKVGNHDIRIVPTAKSVSGCLNLNTCYSNCTLTSDANGLHISACNANAFCPTNQIVNLYIDTLTYDTNNELTKAKFRINFEDSEQGADYDMDAIVTYTIEKVTGSNTDISVTVDSSEFAAGCIDQVIGFIISGTATDGLYLPVKDDDVSAADGDTPAVVAGLPKTWTKVFTVSNTSGGLLKDPLWYTAKWGGFADSNGSRTPDLTVEWDKDSNSVPDNYFFVSNPLRLYDQLNRAFTAILGRMGSAGAVATVTQQVMGQDIVVRGAFTSYEGNPDTLVWKGHVESYWPFEGCSIYPTQDVCTTVAGCQWSDPGCESVCFNNTSQAACLLQTGCQWASGECTATADLFTACTSFVNQTGCQTNSACQWAATSRCTGLLYSFQKQENWNRFCYEHEDHCWEAEDKLPTPNNRVIYTLINGVQSTFDSAHVCTADDWLGLGADATYNTNDCSTMIEWIRGGQDSWTKGRDRNGWVLGDIIYSTPVVVQAPSLSAVPISAATPECNANCPDGCVDCASNCAKKCFFCYRDCLQHRKKVTYVGGNDGMLHAFLTGIWFQDPNATAARDDSHWIYDPNESTSKCHDAACTGADQIGKELWSYIPSNLLSKVKELARKSYGTTGGCTHRYMVDLSPQAWDVFIDPDGIGAEPRQWRTVLLGGERGGGDTYFAIDVTDPDNPKILWEFSAFRNMVQMTAATTTSYQAAFPYVGKTTYDLVKALPMSWSVPYAGKLKIPDGVGFLAADTVNSWTAGTPVPSPSTRYAADLSGWFAVIGSGPRIFNTDDLPNTLTSAQKRATLKPNLLMIDIEKGINIFQYVWPLLQASLGTQWPDVASSAGGNSYIPYAMANPVILDIWDENGKIGNNDGYMDHIYLGDLNGNLYGLKFNLDDATNQGMQVDIWKTKTIPAPDNTTNAYRAPNRQPVTVLPTVAFDDLSNLRVYFGTGKYDNVEGASNDKTDTAAMSFYNLKDSSVRPTINQPTTATKTTSTTFSTNANPAASSPLGFKMDNFGIQLYPHCASTTFNTGCDWVASDKSADCCEANCTGSCWTCIYDLLQPGERVIDSALVAGRLVFFTTFVPKVEPCAVGGISYLYVLDYQCGPMSKDPLASSGFSKQLDAASITQECQYAATTSGTSTSGYVAMLGPGMPSRPVLDSSGEFLFIQTSDGRIHRVKVDLDAPPMIIKGWKQE